MAQTQFPEKPRNEQFPVLYADGELVVYKNPTREIFVKDKRTGTTLRIKPCRYGKGGLEFTTDQLVLPFQVNGMIGYRVGSV